MRHTYYCKEPCGDCCVTAKGELVEAIENKIILLSRKSYPTTEDCSSYAVGYYAPNDRAEISGLINDIKMGFQTDMTEEEYLRDANYISTPDVSADVLAEQENCYNKIIAANEEKR